MQAIIKHWKSCKELKKTLFSNTKEIDNVKNLYWYDINIQVAASFLGFLKVILWRIKKLFDFSKKIAQRPRTDTYEHDEVYQHENPKNYGVESIYYKPLPKVHPKYPNPSIWNCKTLKSSAWFENDNWCRLLEKNAEIIKEEFFSSKDQCTTHPGDKLLAENGKWSSIVLVGTKGINQDVAKYFPKTMAILEKMPICKTFGFVAFSKFSPGTHIKTHTGASNLRLRYHLGIDAPEPESVKIRVGEKTKPWIQDKCIVFDDSYDHEVFHNGKKDRIVLIVDLWHPELSIDEISVLQLPVFSEFGKI